MNALSSQAAKLKEKRVKKVVKSSTVRKKKQKEHNLTFLQVKSSPTQSKPPVDVLSNVPTTPPVTPLATTISDQPQSPHDNSTG